MTKNEKGEYLEKESEGETKIKTYLVQELKGIAFVWIHNLEAKQLIIF